MAIPDGPERRKARAAVHKNNCVVKYRADDERAIQAVRDGKLFFSSALGYNDPYDTLMYIDYVQLSDYIGGILWHSLLKYGEHQRDKIAYNYLASAFFDRIFILLSLIP